MWMIEGINPETHGRNVVARNAANAVLARVETPQATNKMQEAELAPAAEPVANSDQEKPTQKFGYRVGQKVYLPRRGSIRQAEILEFGDSYIRVRYENIDGETITMNFAADYFEKLKKQAEAMMEADLENGEKGQKAVEPVEENKPKVRGRKQVEKAVEKMRKADAEGNALEVLNNIQTAELNARRGDEGAITPEEQAEIDALKKKYAEQGYEMEDMTGKVYDEGMQLEAEFVIDESLPDGAAVIKTTRKPYIFKDGVLVQKANVVVALSPVKAIEPIGKGYFGEIYDQFKNGFKAAFDFLVGKMRGEAVGVFNREGIGEIDLVWGDEKAGLSHILTKHVGEGKSFESLEDAKNGIADVVENGKVVFQDGDKVVIQKDGKIVTLRKNIRDKGKKIADKNWILTAYDETKADDTSAISGTNEGQAARPTVVSEGEGTTQSAKVQEKAQKSGDVKDVSEETTQVEDKEVAAFDKQAEIAKEREQRAGVAPRPGHLAVAIGEGNEKAVEEWKANFDAYL